MTATYLMVGLGKVGLPVAKTLLAQGKKVIGVSRQLAHISETVKAHPSFTHIQANASRLSSLDIGHDSDKITHVCIIVSPDHSTPEAYQDTYLAVCENMVRLRPHLPQLQRLVFISSTSVYGQNTGEIIDINTPLLPPSSATAQILLQAETALQQHFAKQCTIIRPSGIYGYERLRLINMVKQLAMGNIAPPPNTWTNRIFDTDLIAMIVKILQENNPAPIYIATDNEPVPLYEVLSWLAGEMGLKLALPQDLPTNGKRLIHNLPKDSLEFGDFKQGYGAILQGSYA